MDRQIILPSSEQEWLQLRVDDITSTESSALFRMSPYVTEFELFHRKKSKDIIVLEDNDRLMWGRRLQDAIATGIAEDKHWVCAPMKEYIRLPDKKMGSSFDFKMIDESNRIGVFEIKNVDYFIFKNSWTIENNNLIAPEHIEIQLQHQLHVSGYEWGAIGVLVSGNQPHVLIRERDEEVGNAIEKKVQKFWEMVAQDTAPRAFYPDDAEFVASLYGYAEPGKVMDAREDTYLLNLCSAYNNAASIAKFHDQEKTTLKAKILEHIGSHEKCTMNEFTVTANMVGPTHVSYDRAGYRTFRITQKKIKGESHDREKSN